MPRSLLRGWVLLLLFPYAPGQAPTRTIAVQFLFAAANQDRRERGLPQLHFDPQLANGAYQHAREMARQHRISHQFPGEDDLASRAASAGAHFSLVTENVAEAPDSSRIHDLWMNSAGHRANLLDPKVDAVGIAVVWSDGEFFAVEDFAHTVDQLSLEQQENEVASLVARTGLKVSAGSVNARTTCHLATGYAGERTPWFVMRYTSSDIQRLPEQLVDKMRSGRYGFAEIGACRPNHAAAFTSYSLAVMLYP